MQIQKGAKLVTRFGSEVETLEAPDSEGWVKVRRIDDGEIREWNMCDMRIAESTPSATEMKS